MSAHGGSTGDGPRLGAMFGRYRVEAMVSRGAMGVVFRATDTELDRPVALKLLALDSAAADTGSPAFLEEARVAASLDHPAIVPVYEAGVIDGTPFIAMRLVPGMDLARLLRAEAPLTLAATLRIVAPIAAALDAAHAHGLVHGDVKPGNVLVESAAEGRVYLADFGLTWRMDAASGATTRPGTLEYMAPELLSGGVIDGRADQYALGCVVAHCLLGHPPFERGTDQQLLEAHLTEEPPSVEAQIPGGCAGLDAQLGRAMAKRPGDRFADCASFISGLRSLARADDPTTRAVPPRDTVPAAPIVAARATPIGSTPEVTAEVPSSIPVVPAPAATSTGRSRTWKLPRDRRTVGGAFLAAIALILALGSIGLIPRTGSPSSPPLPSGVTPEQRAWEKEWIGQAEDAAFAAGWQRCAAEKIRARDRDCPTQSLDCSPLRKGPQFAPGDADAGIMCQFSTDQAVLNGFLFHFPSQDARRLWYAFDVIEIGEIRDATGSCADGEPSEGPWRSASITGRFACWFRPPADGDTPHWWLGWYEDSSERLGLLVSQPVDVAAGTDKATTIVELLEAWRALPRPLGVSSAAAAATPGPAGGSAPSEGAAAS